MPKKITIELDKSSILQIIENSIKEEKDSENLIQVEIKIPVQLTFEKGEVRALKDYVDQNLNFDSLKIKFPGYLNLMDFLTDELIKEQIPKLQITINENKRVSESTMEYF